MAAIVTVGPRMGSRRPQRIGTQLHWLGTVTLPASYDAGGSVLSAKLLAFNMIEGAILSAAGGYVFETIYTAGSNDVKIKVFKGAAGLLVEETAATDLSAVKPSIMAWGH